MSFTFLWIRKKKCYGESALITQNKAISTAAMSNRVHSSHLHAFNFKPKFIRIKKKLKRKAPNFIHARGHHIGHCRYDTFPSLKKFLLDSLALEVSGAEMNGTLIAK